MIVGRQLWLWSIKRVLEHTAKVLHQHKWSIIRPPDGLSWFTSDSPVIRLNYANAQRYDLNGGWGSPGTEIIMPLDPQHLLYAQIAKRPRLSRNERMPFEQAMLMRRMIAEHAHRLIFSLDREADVPRLRPRTVDADFFRHEREQWSAWHEQQTSVERKLRCGSGPDPQ